MVSSTANSKPSRRDRHNGRRQFTKKSKQTNSRPKNDEPVETPREQLFETDLPSSTFEVLVGTGGAQQMIAVHEKVIERSEILRREKRWNEKYEAQIMLVNEEPRLFSAYLHTVYFGAEHLKRRILPEDEESSTDADAFLAKQTENAKFLIDLHRLADRLLDPVTADVVIDELIRILYDVDDPDGKVSFAVTTRMYASNTDGSSPLRKLVRDLRIHHIGFIWALRYEYHQSDEQE